MTTKPTLRQKQTPPLPAIRPYSEAVNPVYAFTRGLILLFERICFRVEFVNIERVPKTGPVLILPTHTSMFDPPMIGTALKRECHFLARGTLFRLPLWGWFIERGLNAHPLQRGGGERQAINLCQAILRADWPLAYFPEGTRSSTGKLGKIQRGFARILEPMPDVPYVPVIAQETARALPKGAYLPRPRKVRIYFGEPTYVPRRGEDEHPHKWYDRCVVQLERQLRELGAQ